MPKIHRTYTRPKSGPGRKLRAKQRKSVRAGARNPGATGQGSTRRPY